MCARETTVKTVPAGLSVVRIGDDGKLTFVRAYDIDVGDKIMFWTGMVGRCQPKWCVIYE
jgi:hypothetical protein